MINKYRRVEYTDDGCTAYECLKCKAQWEARNFWNVYCGKCGTKWDGELVWDTEKCGAHRKYLFETDYYADKPYWTAQVRWYHKDGTEFGVEWKDIHHIYYDKHMADVEKYKNVSAKFKLCINDIKEHMQDERKDTWSKDWFWCEYRIVKYIGSKIVQIYPTKFSTKIEQALGVD